MNACIIDLADTQEEFVGSNFTRKSMLTIIGAMTRN